MEDEGLPVDINTSNDAESHQAMIERMNPETDSGCEFRKTLDHGWKDGTLVMKAQYTDDTQGTFEIDTPFKKLKLDEPLACAKCIREYTAETRRGDRPMNDWADNIIKQNMKTIKRMVNVQPNNTKFNPTEDTIRRMFQRATNLAKLHHQINLMRIRRNGPTRNKIIAERAAQAALGQKSKPRNKEKFGMKIPNTIEEALKFDREAGNHKWAEAIKKEMDNLIRLNVFKFQPADKEFPKSEG